MHFYGWYGTNMYHVAAAIYRVEAAIQIGLINLACTSNANELLPNRKTIEQKKRKDLDCSRENFGQRGKKDAISSHTKKDV